MAKPLAIPLLCRISCAESGAGDDGGVSSGFSRYPDGVMPRLHNECFSVSLTDNSNLTPFKVGCLLLNTHAHPPTHNNTVYFFYSLHL